MILGSSLNTVSIYQNNIRLSPGAYEHPHHGPWPDYSAREMFSLVVDVLDGVIENMIRIHCKKHLNN